MMIHIIICGKMWLRKSLQGLKYSSNLEFKLMKRKIYFIFLQSGHNLRITKTDIHLCFPSRRRHIPSRSASRGGTQEPARKQGRS